ncbi:MAG TPA: uL15m family ribosomal protein [Candidatus Moranbacteria bacterium]|nr:uL15m family ribosomal protein [Candidatus Moranbacteria bacterium]
MQINSLKLKNRRKKRKTIGRGGKKGTYSGKGNKGQKARSGAKVDPLFEGGRSTLIDHMKKKRGFKALNCKKAIINLENISKKFKSGDLVSAESLIKAGLVDKMEAKNGIKVLGGKDIKIKLSFDKKILLSKSVKETVEK